MIRPLVSFCLLVLVATGCRSRPLGPYSSPRIAGQVLDADTREPLAGVRVTRGPSPRKTTAATQPKGGELMMRQMPMETNRAGRFVLASEHVLSIVRGSGWDVVWLSFDRPGYLHFETNYPITNLTNAPGRKSLQDIGLVFLQPAAR